jgi:hypothetical protein
MAYSKITINFNGITNVGDVISFIETKNNLTISEIFNSFRNGSYRVAIPGLMSNGITYNGFISTNYKNAFNSDYNSGNLFSVVTTTDSPISGGGKVIITANYSGAIFSLLTNTSNSSVQIENEVVGIPFEIVEDNFTRAVIPCQNAKYSVTTTVLATKIIYPISVNSNTQNPFEFEVLRGGIFNLTFEDIAGNSISKIVTAPSLLNASNFSISVLNSPNGASVTVKNNGASNGLILQYSLDNVVFQNSNIFNGLLAGNFILYVKDQLGCSFNKAFQVSEFNINNPYFYISKSNSIRYAKRITFGISSNYKNDENTLSCEENVKLPYKEVQQFQSSDSITTQFKSNYKTNIAKVIRENSTEIIIPISKLSSNIGVKDKRDAIKYDLGGDKTGIYFTAGNIYDFNTNAIVQAYALNGSLPFWANTKNYITINNAWFKIQEIIFDENKNAEVIVILDNYSGGSTNVIAGSIYNLFDYEVYEYTIDMGDFINENIQVKLENSDTNFPTITHLSEEINIQEIQNKTIEIRYRNSDNTDVFYGTGIEHKIRLQYYKINAVSDEQSEIYKTDTNTVMLSAEIYEVTEFILEPVTKEIMRKIIQALSHKIVFIDEVGYVKNGNVEIEGPLEDTNLYVVKAKMIKNGNVYNSTNGDNDEVFVGGTYEIPGIIETDNEFLAY